MSSQRVNVDQMGRLLHTEVSMLKVLDTYKRSVDYYNSYGLEEGPNSTRRPTTESRIDTEQSFGFWNYGR